MKRYLLSFTLLLMGIYLHAQKNECGSRQVYGFDLDITGENPYTKWQTVTDQELLQTVNKLKELWQGLHMATPGYISQLSSGDRSTSGRVNYQLALSNPEKPWVAKTCYGSPSKNYSAQYGDIMLTATYMSQPPKPDFIDYIIYGSLAHENYTKGTIEIKVTNFRENEELCTRLIKFDNSPENKLSPYDAAAKMMTGFAQDFENTIMPGYEKNKRDKFNSQDNGVVAIDPKLEFDQPSYSIQNTSPANSFKKITITLRDCDGVPLKNKVLTLKSSKGKITPEKIKTDSYGKAQILYFAIENNYSDKISATWSFKHPSGRTDMVEAGAMIKVSSPADEIYARIVINVHNTIYRPSKQNQRESSDQTYVISGQLRCNIDRDRIAEYQDNPERRSECDANMHCPVLNGFSYYKERDPENAARVIKEERYPLRVSVDVTEKGYCTVSGREQYVRTLVKKLEGINKYESLSLEIKPYVSPEGSNIAMLTNAYVIWLTGSRYIDKMALSPEGNGEVLKWDYTLEKLVPTDGPFTIGIPYLYSEPDRNPSPPDIYEPLMITDVNGLDKYLLDPSGEYYVEAKAIRKMYDENNSESEGEIFFTITFSTVPEKVVPAEEDDPEF